MKPLETFVPITRFLVALTTPGRWWLIARARVQCWLWRMLADEPDAAKRLCDVVFSLSAIILLSPLLLFIGLCIKLEDGEPVVFCQTRVGKHGCTFKMYKFRSMHTGAEASLEELLARNHHREGVTFKIKNDPRLTRVGKWLRKFSLDELPQFFNVLKGDMSLVGPRPSLPREVALYPLHARCRLAVKPGITCFWQISGRSEIDFSRQVRLDVKYIEGRSLLTDFKILFKTVPAVLSGKGAC